MRLKPKHVKYQRSSAKGTFSKLRLNGRNRKNVRFSTENWPYLKNGDR